MRRAFYRYEQPVHPTSLTAFRKRIGEAGCEYLLSTTVDAALDIGSISKGDLKEVVIDTTVMEKAAEYPTDSRFYHTNRERLVKLAKEHGLPFFQSYVRKSRYALQKAGRYAHASHYKRICWEVKRLKIWLGRLVRDIDRKLIEKPVLADYFTDDLQLVRQLLTQIRHSKNKLYSLNALEVECIAKGKTKRPANLASKSALQRT